MGIPSQAAPLLRGCAQPQPRPSSGAEQAGVTVRPRFPATVMLPILTDGIMEALQGLRRLDLLLGLEWEHTHPSFWPQSCHPSGLRQSLPHSSAAFQVLVWQKAWGVHRLYLSRPHDLGPAGKHLGQGREGRRQSTAGRGHHCSPWPEGGPSVPAVGGCTRRGCKCKLAGRQGQREQAERAWPSTPPYTCAQPRPTMHCHCRSTSSSSSTSSASS